MSKHTPGPWVVLSLEDRISIATMVDKRRASIVCRIANSVSRRPLDGEDDANARLIAAAPELLEALKKLLDSCLYGEDGDRLDEIHAAQAAITKAEGKS